MTPELVFITATAMEMRAVIEGLGLDLPVPETGGFRRARVNGRAARLAVSGIGPLAAAFAAGSLSGEGFLSGNTCSGILCLGIAGTYDACVAPLGAAAFATREIWPEYGLVTEQGVDPIALGFPLAGKKNDTVSPPVWNSLDLDPRSALEAMGLADPSSAPRIPENPLCVAGASVTVAGVSATRERAAYLAGRHKALTENMEGFPLALAARQAGVPFAEVRTVSNIAGKRDAAAWDIPLALASLARIASLVFPV